jgi:hypothetical protein
MNGMLVGVNWFGPHFNEKYYKDCLEFNPEDGSILNLTLKLLLSHHSAQVREIVLENR